MKKIVSLFIAYFLITTIAFTQEQNTTYLDIVSVIAKKQNLELSYSPDLVNLSSISNFKYSENSDSCIIQIEKQAGVKISLTKTHLIVMPAPPAKIELKGKVINAQTGETLPHAHLLIQKAGTGTITNSQGIFSFKVNGKLAGEEIIFSFLGYENSTIRIPFFHNDSLRVEMQPKPYNLADVYVLPNGNEAVDIVKRAAKNIKQNYHRQTIQMEAFYRNTSFRNDTASQLIEAALLIEDKGIDNSTTTTKIDLQEIRKSSNYLNPQKLKYRILKKFWGHKNVIYRCYNRNMVRNYKTDWWFRPLINYNDFKYEFEGIVWLDSIKVYKIKYIWNSMLPDGKRVTEHKSSKESGGYFYINATDFGVIKTETLWPYMNTRRKKLGLTESNLKRNEVAYQKINGKYYLKYASGFTVPNGSFLEFEDLNVPTKDLKIKTWQWAEEILLVTQIITDRKQFDKIKYREKLARDENSYRKNYPYNTDFWRNYNLLKENPVEEKFIKEMEWEKSMDVQFKENSTNNAGNN